MNSMTRSTVTLRNSKALDDDVYSVTIFANELSRDGVTLDLDGMDFSNYEKNPVVLYAHDFMGRTESGGLPIGRTLKLIRTRDGHIRADFEFLAGDDFAERVRNAWNQGFLRGASIGWRTIESRPTKQGIRAVKSELLEWSIVAVPADPDALRDAYRRVMSALIDEVSDEVVVFDHSEVSGLRSEDSVPHSSPLDTAEDIDLSETRRLVTELRKCVA